jgi:hypothetical protein
VSGVQDQSVTEHPIHELDDDVHKRELTALHRIMAQIGDAEVDSEAAPESTKRTRG